jgi:hypothetical protein
VKNRLITNFLFSEDTLLSWWEVKALKDEETKGVVLVRYADGTEKFLPKITYLRMKKAGRKITLLKEGSHYKDLR